jgi:hypothetical protein
MRRRVILHPLLFGVYAVLFAYAHNLEFAPPVGEIAILLALAGGGAALLWGVLTFATGSARKAAIAASAIVLMFFSHGHVKNFLTIWFWDFHVFTLQIGTLKILGFLWLAVSVIVAWWLWNASRNATAIATTALDRAGIVLVALSTLQLMVAGMTAARGGSGEHGRIVTEGAPVARSQTRGSSPDAPDIYYIILDDYARSDVLKDLYGYDNTAFLDWLRERGFYVAHGSRSNYSQTMLSLASSLNSTYLDPAELKTAASSATDSRWHVAFNSAAIRFLNSPYFNIRLPLAHMIQYSRVARTLKERGYRFVAFTSGYGGVQLPNADVVRRATVLNDFEESLISTTPIPDVLDRVYDPVELHRQRVRYVFDHLADSFGHDAPLFVFAHILCPHPPFVFDSEGAPVHRSTAKPGVIFDDDVEAASPADRVAVVDGYRGQVQYVNRRIQGAIDAILADSSRPKIIVLQGDHGTNMTLDSANPSAAALKERMSILNAYYVPSEIRTRLYPSITPVNTFRIILGHSFADPPGLLGDKSYFSKWNSPYDFVPVSGVISNVER